MQDYKSVRITFLGTGAGWPLPRLGCGCEICASRDPHNRRLRPSLLVELPVETGQPVVSLSNHAPSLHKKIDILIDPGPDLYHQLIRLPRETTQNISHCLITHAHPDHVLGLSDLGHIYNKRQRVKLIAPDTVFKDLQHNFRNISQNLRNFEIVRADGFEVGEWKINFIPVPHSNAVKTFAIDARRTADGAPILFYAPDIAELTPEIIKIIKQSQIAILDASSWGKAGQTHTHISICEIIEQLKNCKAQIYLTHLGHKTLLHQVILEKLKSYPNIRPAYDGLIVSS